MISNLNFTQREFWFGSFGSIWVQIIFNISRVNPNLEMIPVHDTDVQFGRAIIGGALSQP